MVLTGLSFIYLAERVIRAWIRRRDQACVWCEYNLAGTPAENPCPECGKPRPTDVEMSKIMMPRWRAAAIGLAVLPGTAILVTRIGPIGGPLSRSELWWMIASASGFALVYASALVLCRSLSRVGAWLLTIYATVFAGAAGWLTHRAYDMNIISNTPALVVPIMISASGFGFLIGAAIHHTRAESPTTFRDERR